jgi:hypothetical protein
MTNKTQKQKRIRAVAGSEQGVGMQRYRLYQRAWDQIGTAVQSGFYLEAITLIESLISDRLESRARYLTGDDHGFQNLGPLLKVVRATDRDPDFLEAYKAIDKWRDSRNGAMHEVVKFEQGACVTWDDKVKPLPSIVRQGRHALKAYDTLDKRDRRLAGRRTATDPHAFRG